MNAEIKPVSGVLFKSLGFSLVLALLFTLVANLLPQVEGEAPVEQAVDLSSLTVESFSALGERLFAGKGTCALCHNTLGRAPDILALDMQIISAEHLQDQRYQGNADDTESYLRESMLDPGIYVVKGFGKKGSNDSVSPMPAVNKPPIELSEIEVNAVIAYLQAKDGNEVTVPLPSEAPAATVQQVSPTVLADTVEAVVTKYGCQACHRMLGSGGDLGPDLGKIGDRLSSDKIRQSIIDPNAVIVEGFSAGVMPDDLAGKMLVKELELMVTYLASGEKPVPPPESGITSTTVGTTR
ncbi:MAG: cytochrome c [Gammaproteobacteria bacterium]|nr:cytochrome c [Gammaproteobacteria bacterium]